MDKRQEWTSTRDELVHAVNNLGFPDELGNLIAKQLGSPNARRRIIGLPATIGGLALCGVAAFVEMPIALKVGLIVFGVLMVVVVAFIAVGIEHE